MAALMGGCEPSTPRPACGQGRPPALRRSSATAGGSRRRATSSFPIINDSLSITDPFCKMSKNRALACRAAALGRRPTRRAETLAKADFPFPISAFSFQVSSLSLPFPHYHVSTRIQVNIFNKTQKISEPRRSFCGSAGIEPRISRMTRMEINSFLIRAILEIRGKKFFGCGWPRWAIRGFMFFIDCARFALRDAA
jgi:hypothetical protein